MSDGAESPADIEDILNLAGRMADAARPEVLARFRSGIGHEAKGDASPVTEADRAAERVMRDILGAERPADGIFGEEFGVTNPDAETVWILDPIDGTKSFITGKPVFGTLIGVVREDQAIAGVMDIPPTADRWSGALGQPTLFNGAPVTTRPCGSLSDAWMTTTSPDMFVGNQKNKFDALDKAARYTVYGSDCLGYGQLANGWMDIVCEDSMAPYDYAALIPIVEGAGGVMTDWSGARLTFEADGDSKAHSVLATGSPELHAAAVDALS